MDLKFFISSLAVLYLISKVASQEKCPPLVEYMWSFDYALDHYVIKKFHNLPEHWCLAKCSLNKRCRSVNYSRKRSSTYNCELNSGSNQQYPKSYNPRPGWVYYENKIADTLPPVVDGGWGAWEPWSSDCPTDCLQGIKKTRTRTRTRTCSNPAPQGDGLDCTGAKIEQEICGSPGCFELLQTFHTNYGTAVTSFEMREKLFIAFANYVGISGPYTTKIPIYAFEKHNFTLNQTLDTFRAQDVEYFTICGNHFLVVASTAFITSNNKDEAIVYRWEAGIFEEFQRIPTNGVQDSHYFTINKRKFLSFSIITYGSTKVSIYEWKNKKFSDKIQDIQIADPIRCNTFTIHNITYIACGSGWASADAATVFKWSGSQFEPFQVLPSSYVYGHPHIIHANGSVYLAIANFKKSQDRSFDTDSFIYQWNGIKFVHHQSIPTHGARGWDSFSAAAGEVFLVVANSYTQSGTWHKVKSAVYKMADNRFNLYQQLPTAGAECVHAFTHKGKQYLAVVNRFNGKTHNLDSPVYNWL